MAYAFGRYVCVPETRELLADGAPVELGQRAFAILVHLVEHAGRTVTKAELFGTVWPGRAVEDNNLTVQMSAIRRALGGAERARECLITVPGIGYRFVAEIRVGPASRIATRDARPDRVGNLPHPVTSFVGRDAEIAEIGQRLATSRLLTLTGIGGIGKTRVALRYGAIAGEHYPDGVWLIDLALLPGGVSIEDAIAGVFGLAGDHPGAVERNIISHLRASRALLIIDNCEHVVVHAARFVSQLLQGTQHLRVLATSREILGAAGEAVCRIPPLPFPQPGAGQDAMRFDAVRLFVERAAAAAGDMTLDEASIAAAVQICARLDGIALAIEMAVPWLRILTPVELAERLRERLRLLSHAEKSPPLRQRTLRSMIDWSYESLSPSEARLLQRLSAFAGPVTLGAIEAVADGGDPAAGSPASDLSRLVEKSLVVVERDGERLRFRLLETIKEYAGEKLATDGADETFRRHALYYLGLFQAAEREWAELSTAAWAARYLGDAEEFRAALAWAFGPAGDPDIGRRPVAVGYPLWWDLPQLPLREARYWFERALPFAEAPGLDPDTGGRFWLGYVWKDMRKNDVENRPAAMRAVAAFREAGEPMGLGAALVRYAATMFDRDTARELRPLYLEAEAVLRPLGPSHWLTVTLVNLGDVHLFCDEPVQAHPYYSEALSLSDQLGQWYPRTICTTNLSELLFTLGRGEEAIDILLDLLDRSIPSRRTPALPPLVSNLLMAGRRTEMAQAAAEALELAGASGFRAARGWVMEALALHLADSCDLQRAARFSGFALSVHPNPAVRIGSRRAIFVRLQAALSQGLPPAHRAALAAEGAGWGEERAGLEGLAVCRGIA